MPNPNYLAGRRLEYKVKKFYSEYGYHVLRSAGSHGFFDLTVIVPEGSVIFIQLKLVKTAKGARALCQAFEKKPPLPKGQYKQMLEVHVKGESMVYYGLVESI